ncbi:LysR family transcriptional regulator ArgP [Aureimonas phyllosphaerae]|uniref:LysR family transcriptional regulator (Chromosome initiation inhibitor) n=1 Tax=Aureimonas phyllosphaerae TaxID=1166078 RepID=A0A7W6BRJ4_9HYPH|nr:LysR family transcriptional regulator ArgP [Aureimonas phyllosphaerae]MBB3934674.1 LysR family transcriptional regulator (chromosome initiation inhibitor) [Aureimonas phyllosphaerae]MBB3958110.1 LysR family transcriptional regulator (chromosome initiation inhibitor) [Aureimonas phyllosphaerae]SFE91972.1 LysR family transcriptional regulator, chromosome initiation inhibitor [Aureimonas phyllosphaerae]
MLDYPALSAVAAVIREGSFERAAQALAITPSAVSQRVRGLEERLGAILVVRGQPCRPTDLGRTLCAHLERVRLMEMEVALGLPTTEASETNRPPLRIAVNSDSLATWFPAAVAAFGRATGALLNLTLDDEAHTADRLRSGDVLAAVTADARSVQGCRTTRLGALRYIACASPDFAARFFADGVTPTSLSAAPCLRFDRRDGLQARWARETLGVEFDAPVHTVASTHAFVDFALAGLAWGMQPAALAAPHLATGHLVALTPDGTLDVMLYWTVARLPVASLPRLTDAVRAAAKAALVQAGTTAS